MSDDETYALTPWAVAAIAIGDKEEKAAFDAIELHMRRFYSSGGVPAIIFDDGKMFFASIEKGGA